MFGFCSKSAVFCTLFNIFNRLFNKWGGKCLKTLKMLKTMWKMLKTI